MDPATITFFSNATAPALLVVAVIYFYKRDLRRDAQADSDKKEAKERCDSDRNSLAAKVDRLEERISGLYESTIQNATTVLERFLERQDMTPPDGIKHQ